MRLTSVAGACTRLDCELTNLVQAALGRKHGDHAIITFACHIGRCESALIFSQDLRKFAELKHFNSVEMRCGAAAPLLLVAFSSLASAAPLAALSSCGGFLVDPATQRFVDLCGRQRFFRGMNKVEKGPPYFPHPVVFASGDSLTPGDAALQQSLGFNALRLGVMWAGVAPTRGGGFNASYLATLAAISEVFGDGYGVNTLVDAHQDLLSEAFCADGAPIWLAHDMAARAPQAFPLPLASSPCAWDPTGRPAGDCCAIYGRLRSGGRQLQGWADYYLTSAVSFGFQQLYTNATFATQFAEFYGAVAAAFTPLARNLVGYEVLNEPWAGDVLADPLLLVPGVADAANLQPFYERVAAAVRAVAPRTGVLLYEGVTWDDVFPLGFTALPDADAGLAAISYHYYDLPGLDFQLDIAQRAADMKRLRAGGLLTEFAVYPDGFCPTDLTCMRRTLDSLEQLAHGYFGWEYATLWNGSAVIDARAYEMARPFPMAVAGDVEAYALDRTSGRFTLNFTAPPAGGAGCAPPNATVVFASLGLYFPSGFVAALAAAPADAVHAIDTPCWAGAGPGGSTVAPPGCAPAQPPPTQGAPPPFAFGYAVLQLTSVTGGHVSLVLQGL